MTKFRTFLPLSFIFLMSQLSFAGPKVLLTGGTGYIGSHVAVVLMQNGYDVVLVDNLANSDASVIERIEHIAGKKVTAFYQSDLTEKGKIDLC